MASTRSQTGQNEQPSLASKDQGKRAPNPSSPANSQTSSKIDLPTSVQNRGCKRKQPTEDARETCLDPDSKRQRTTLTRPSEDASSEPAAGCGASRRDLDPIAFWAEQGRWPEKHSWPEIESTMDHLHLLARKKSSPNLARKRSDSATSTTPSVTTVTPSDQRPREEKSAPYRHRGYERLLQTHGSYMTKAPSGLASASQALCRSLLEKPQPVPSDTLFRDDIFEATCQKIHNKNEARVIQDISRLIVPSAESLATYGATHLDILAESVNEGWNSSIPIIKPRPQPDYAVGFGQHAFTQNQLARLSPFIGDCYGGDQSFFMATDYMYFPFLTCEVKCGGAALDTADRQNTHSMTSAARAIVELFRLVKREEEVNRQILAFSISHDDRIVRIYGHYPVINGKDTKYYRHPIHTFDFTALNGRDKWTAYRFTKNVYDTWMPDHYKNLCAAIDALPDSLDFDVSSLSGLSQNLGNLMPPPVAGFVPVEGDNQSSNADSPADTPDTSISRSQGAKRRKD